MYTVTVVSIDPFPPMTKYFPVAIDDQGTIGQRTEELLQELAALLYDTPAPTTSQPAETDEPTAQPMTGPPTPTNSAAASAVQRWRRQLTTAVHLAIAKKIHYRTLLAYHPPPIVARDDDALALAQAPPLDTECQPV